MHFDALVEISLSLCLSLSLFLSLSLALSLALSFSRCSIAYEIYSGLNTLAPKVTEKKREEKSEREGEHYKTIVLYTRWAPRYSRTV